MMFMMRICLWTDDSDPDDGFNYRQMMARDERRFKMADIDGDSLATKEEFTAFLHPEEFDYMKDTVVLVCLWSLFVQGYIRKMHIYLYTVKSGFNL